MSDDSNLGVIQYIQGIFCLVCRRYIGADDEKFPFVTHPEVVGMDCPNKGKTYQIVSLKEVR